MERDEIEMADILRSLIIDANPNLIPDQVDHLVIKYLDAVWDRAAEVYRGA